MAISYCCENPQPDCPGWRLARTLIQDPNNQLNIYRIQLFDESYVDNVRPFEYRVSLLRYDDGRVTAEVIAGLSPKGEEMRCRGTLDGKPLSPDIKEWVGNIIHASVTSFEFVARKKCLR